MNYHQSTKDLNDFILWSRSNEVRKRRVNTNIERLKASLKKSLKFSFVFHQFGI